MNESVEPPEEEKESSIEEVAREKLGVAHWDRPGIYHDTAEAATDAGFPYWSVLVLSGAIATLGLALDNEAVVIGAMLIARCSLRSWGSGWRWLSVTCGWPSNPAYPSR